MTSSKENLRQKYCFKIFYFGTSLKDRRGKFLCFKNHKDFSECGGQKALMILGDGIHCRTKFLLEKNTIMSLRGMFCCTSMALGSILFRKAM